MTPTKLQPKNLIALFLLACLFAYLPQGSLAQSDNQEKVQRLVDQLTAVLQSPGLLGRLHPGW